MASTAQLKAQGREIEARLASFAKDFEEAVDEKGAPKYTEDEKETAYKTLRDEFTSWSAQMARSEGASEMASKLAEGGCGTALDTKSGKVLNTNPFESANPFADGGIKRLAYEASQDPEFQKTFGFKDGFRKKIDHTVELGLKTNLGANYGTDGVEANQTIGEGFGGNTTPTGIGQNVFPAGPLGPGIMPDWRPGIVEQLFYQLTINDLLSSFATTAPNISYLTESLANLQANAVAEAGQYPFSSIELARDYAQIGKIANALTVTDEVLSDAATLYNFVQARLLLSIQRREEVEILAGTGYPGVGGLLSFAANYTAATAASGSLYNAGTATTLSNVVFPPAGTNGAGVQPSTITTLNVGRVVTGAGTSYPDPLTVSLNLKDAAVDIELAVFQSPTAHIMHPRDWERIETAQDANQQFMNTNMFGNVYGVSKAGNIRTLWNVPVVTTPLIPQGLILTGWFSPQSAQVARRQGVQMQMTNSNESDFINGKITVRAEERLGLLCYRPTAFQLTHLVAG